MKAAVFHGVHNISIDDIQVPEPNDYDVLVKVKACGVCGTDLHIYEGAKGAADCKPPTVLGHEFSGIVERVGTKVTEFSPGDRVAVDPNNVCGECRYCLSGKAHFCSRMIGTGTTADGGFAEYCRVHRRQLTKIGDHLSFEEGAMAEPISCCLHGLDLTGVQTGDDVLIIGGGTIGQIMLRLCVAAGASRIAMLEPIAHKRELALKSGAVLAENPLAENTDSKLLKAFPFKFDRVIECVGSKATMENAIRFAGNASTVMLFGLTSPKCTIEVYPYTIFQREITLRSSYINPYTIGRAVSLLNSRKLTVRDMIMDVISLKDCLRLCLHEKYGIIGKTCRRFPLWNKQHTIGMI